VLETKFLVAFSINVEVESAPRHDCAGRLFETTNVSPRAAMVIAVVGIFFFAWIVA
jgi:hypothetical protein